MCAPEPLTRFALDEPAFGHVLYLQDLTGLNDYFRATHTAPMGAVGGEWPELGYLPPTPPQSGTPPVNPLPADEEVMLSDAILVLRDLTAGSEQEKARQFVEMLGEAYTAMRHPAVIYRDWHARADRTLKDLNRAPVATCTSYGHRYLRPYTDAEYPDSMVQMTVTTALYEYGRWRGEPVPLAAEFAAGMEKFYDPELKTLRRYLPNVARTRMPMRSTAGTSTTRFAISPSRRCSARNGPATCSFARSTTASAPRTISIISGQSSTMCATSQSSPRNAETRRTGRPTSEASMPM